MKINGNTIRPGMVIEHKERLWVAVKVQHTQPGKGGAYQQVELKDIHQKRYQFLFAEGGNYTFMDNETYEQIVISRDMIGAERAQFLTDDMTVTIESYEDSPIRVELPDTVVMAVVDAEPVIKGQTAASSHKPAILENGARTMVPPHIEVGTRVVVNTADGSYVERAKD